jgi:hypothetical protein
VHQRRVGELRGAGQTADGERVDGERLLGLVLGAVDVVERRAVDDERRL